jgi:hypothetical protein
VSSTTVEVCSAAAAEFEHAHTPHLGWFQTCSPQYTFSSGSKQLSGPSRRNQPGVINALSKKKGKMPTSNNEISDTHRWEKIV